MEFPRVLFTSAVRLYEEVDDSNVAVFTVRRPCHLAVDRMNHAVKLSGTAELVSWCRPPGLTRRIGDCL